MVIGRQFVYRYNGDAKSEEVVDDLAGEIPIPEKDQLIERKQQKWRVANLNIEQSVTDPNQLPIYHIFLAGPC